MSFRCSGNQVLKPGTPAKDVICKHTSLNPTLVTTLPTTSLEIPVSITVPGESLYNIAYRGKELLPTST